MGKNKCRECSKCTKSKLGKLVGAPGSVVSGTANMLTLGLFKKKCPVCGHSMKYHRAFQK